MAGLALVDQLLAQEADQCSAKPAAGTLAAAAGSTMRDSMP